MRKCSKCGVERMDQRVHAYCPGCQRAYNRAWRAKNPEKAKTWVRNWKVRHPERTSELSRRSDRKRYWENPERMRAKSMAQWKADPERMRRAYATLPLERKRAGWRIHELVRSGRIVKPAACQQCGERGMRIEGHHPDYQSPEAVVWLCSRCHGATRRKEQTA